MFLRKGITTAVASIGMIVLLVVGVAAGYYASSASATAKTVTSTAQGGTVTSTVTTTMAPTTSTSTTSTTTSSSSSTSSTSAAAGTLPPNLEALAKAEGGTLTVYTIQNAGGFVNVTLPAFNKAYPWLKVNPVFLDSASTITRPTSELKAGKVAADVIEIGNYPRTVTDIANGVCANSTTLASFIKSQGFLDGAYGTDGRWYAYGITLNMLLYNTNLLTGSQVPTSYTDLANPIYKGKIAIDRPSVLGTGGTILASMYPSMGNASWTQFVKNVAANQPALQASGGVVETLVTQGQYALGTDTLSGIVTSLNAGLPVKPIWTSPVYTSFSTACMATQAPHPYTALLWAEWSTSPAGQTVLASGGRGSAIPSVNTAAMSKLPGVPANLTLSTDAAKTDLYTNPNKWSNLYVSIFGQ